MGLKRTTIPSVVTSDFTDLHAIHFTWKDDGSYDGTVIDFGRWRSEAERDGGAAPFDLVSIRLNTSETQQLVTAIENPSIGIKRAAYAALKTKQPDYAGAT